jgi:hypothetical protein
MAFAHNPSDLVDFIICFLLASMNPPIGIYTQPLGFEKQITMGIGPLILMLQYLQCSKNNF